MPICVLPAMWGPHTIDRFALFYNTQLERFDSRFWDPHCEAVDSYIHLPDPGLERSTGGFLHSL